MNLAEGVFLYTPIPYFAAFVLLLYRHNLSRLRHPFRDEGSPRTWWLVLNHLGLLSSEQTSRMPGRTRQFLPYVTCLGVSSAVSLSWTLRVFPPLWYYLVIDQGIAAIILMAATTQYLGTPPRRPYVDVLRYPRLGSRVRHLSKLAAVKEESEPAAEQEGQQAEVATVTPTVQEGAN
jgi:hypothetical protein